MGTTTGPKAKKTELVSIRFDPETIAWLADVSASEGIPLATLVRRWTLKGLAADHPRTGEDAWVTREVDLPE